MKHKTGFSLIEVLVGAAVFTIVATAVYGSFVALYKLAGLNQEKTLAIQLADERFEIVRNMPYSEIGLVGGVPSGTIPPTQTIVRGGVSFTVETLVRNIDLPFDGLAGGSPNDLSPADNRLVEIKISCAACRNFPPLTLTGRTSPKNLETASTNGALFIRVFDANGQPVPDASVRIENVATTTAIAINDTTGIDGTLQIIDVPPDAIAYEIVVTKPGYSSDRTYPITTSNPTPAKANATVLSQHTTQVSFSIDRLGSMQFTSVAEDCSAAGNVSFGISGAKQIGLDIPKYEASLSTDGSGNLSLGSVEWDSYTVMPMDGVRTFAGINPLNPISLSPAGSQNVMLVSTPKNPRSLLVTVKDSATKLPVSDATVRLHKTGYDVSKTTGRGYMTQTDWSGGGGQSSFTDPVKYWSDDGGIDETSSPGNITLREVFGNYGPNGTLESSIFDTGSESDFYTLSWNPSGQPLQVGDHGVKMQFATNATVTATTTWNFIGPDGTGSSYYLAPNSSLGPVHNGDRFARYLVHLSTESGDVTPNVSDVSFTYASSCMPPGEVIFGGLSAGNYSLEVSASGYSNYSTYVDVESDWQEQQVLLAP